MLHRFRAHALLAAMMLALAGCPDRLDPQCTSDFDCEAFQFNGLCLPVGDGTHYCAEPYRPCPSGYRWGKYAPAAISYNCLDKAMIPKDGGVDAAMKAVPVDAAGDGGG